MQNTTSPKWINFTNGTVLVDNINHIIVNKHWLIAGGGCTIALHLKDGSTLNTEKLNCEYAEKLFKDLLSGIQK